MRIALDKVRVWVECGISAAVCAQLLHRAESSPPSPRECRKAFTLIKEQSKFVDWQRIKVQENADEVPAGSLPRTIDVIMRHQAVESANPGDKACFTGMLVVVPDIPAMTLPGNVQGKWE